MFSVSRPIHCLPPVCTWIGSVCELSDWCSLSFKRTSVRVCLFMRLSSCSCSKLSWYKYVHATVHATVHVVGCRWRRSRLLTRRCYGSRSSRCSPSSASSRPRALFGKNWSGLLSRIWPRLLLPCLTTMRCTLHPAARESGLPFWASTSFADSMSFLIVGSDLAKPTHAGIPFSWSVPW